MNARLMDVDDSLPWNVVLVEQQVRLALELRLRAQRENLRRHSCTWHGAHARWGHVPNPTVDDGSLLGGHGRCHSNSRGHGRIRMAAGAVAAAAFAAVARSGQSFSLSLPLHIGPLLAARQTLRLPLAQRMLEPSSIHIQQALLHHAMCLFDTSMSSCTWFLVSSALFSSTHSS